MIRRTIFALIFLPIACAAQIDGQNADSDRDTATAAITGHIDGINDASGSPTLQGWACFKGAARSLELHVYVNGGYGSGQFVTSARADQANEVAVNTVCNTPDGTRHRFSLPLASFQAGHTGKALYVHAINPNGGTHPLIAGSGKYRVPAASTPTPTPTPTPRPTRDPLPVFRWANSSEWFYTRDVRGETAAAYGYRYEGVVFYVLPEAEPDTKPIYRLASGVHRYVVDESERQRLLGDGWKSEGVLGYMATGERAGYAPLYAYLNSSTRHRFLTLYPDIEGPTLLAMGYKSEGVIGYVAKSGARPTPAGYRVGAYYFGMFSPAAYDSPGAFRASEVYGPTRANDWWVGVRDLYENNLPTSLAAQYPITNSWWAEDWSHMQPVIGYYDQSDVRTIRKHIRQAKTNGLSFFNFYWYWQGDRQRELLNDGLDAFLQAVGSEPFDFMIGICAHGWHLTIPRDQRAQVAQLLVRKYLSHKSYLRTKDGRPIVQITDAKGIWDWKAGQPTTPPSSYDMQSIAAFINALRAEARRVLGKEIVISLRMDGGGYGDIVGSLGSAIDAGTCLVPILGDTHDQIVNGLVDWMERSAAGKPLMPCMPHDFDSRPRVGIVSGPERLTYLTRFSHASFRRGLQRIKTWMDGHRDNELSQILSIYAWNEWHEGGVIEPNTKDKALYLNTISDVFQLPIQNDPCRTSGNCSGN